LYLDFEGRFKRLNPAWVTTLGYTLEEVEDQSFLNFLHPDDREESIAAAKR
jgi:twitching motility protein PilJ